MIQDIWLVIIKSKIFEKSLKFQYRKRQQDITVSLLKNS